MSQEAAVQFLEAVPENEELQQKLVKVLETSENDREEAAKLANEYGYDITPEELWAEIQKRQQDLEARKEAGELTDEELEAVAGGEFVATAVVATVVAAAGLGWTVGGAIAPKIKW